MVIFNNLAFHACEGATPLQSSQRLACMGHPSFVESRALSRGTHISKARMSGTYAFVGIQMWATCQISPGSQSGWAMPKVNAARYPLL